MPGNLSEAIAATNMAGKSADQDSLAVSWVQRVYDFLKPLRAPYEREWALDMMLYMTQEVGSNYAGHSRVVLPTAFVLTERLIPRVVAGTVGRGVWFDAAAKSGDQTRQARLQRDLLAYQLDEMGFLEKYTPLMRSVGIYGTGVAKRRWRYEVARSQTVKKVDEPFGIGPGGPTMKPVYKPVEVEAILFDGPDVDEKDIYTVFLDPRSKTNKDTDILEEIQVTKTWLLRQARQGLLSLSQLQKVFEADAPSQNGGSTAPSTTSAQVQRDNALGQQDRPANTSARTYTYRECWCEFPFDAPLGQEYDSETEPALIVTVNGVVVRLCRNPMPDHDKPYLFPVFIQVPGRRYGLSLLTTNLGLFIEKNDTRNMALDAKNLAMAPMLKSRDTKMTGKVVEIEPGRIIVDPTGSLSPITLTDTSPSGYMAEAHINRDLEDSTGAPATMSGQPLQGGGSATEVAATSEQATVRVASYGYSIEETFLKKLLRGMSKDNRAFLDKEKEIRIQGEQGFEYPIVTPDDVQAECDFIMLGASQLTMKMILGAQYAQLIPVMQRVEQQQLALGKGPMYDWTFIMRTLFRDVFNFPHPELAVLPTESETLRPKNPREMMVLIAQGHTPKIDPRMDLADAMLQFAQMLRAVEGRIDPALELRYREFLLDLNAAAQKKIALAMAAGGAVPGAPGPAEPGASPPSGGPPPATGPAQRDGQGMAPGRRAMVALGGGPLGQGRAA